MAYSSTDYVSGSDRIDKTTHKWNIVTTDKKNNSDLDFSDFLNLMIAQLKNQDFMDPVDNSEYMTQMTQFASMQAMNELAEYSKTNYAMSLVGKEVTASRYTASGSIDTTTGTVDKVSLVNNEYILYIGGKTYNMSQIMQVSVPKAEGECAVDPSTLKIESSDISKEGFTVKWTLPTEDEGVQKNLTYQAYYSTDDTIKTVEDVKEKSTAFGGVIRNAVTDEALAATVKGLEAGTPYYVNVIVTDQKGNQAMYKSTVVNTKRV